MNKTGQNRHLHLVTGASSLALAIGMVTTPAAAQTVDPAASDGAFLAPDVAVTATRVPTELDRTAASVTVIEAEEIETRQVRSLPEALNQTQGLDVVSTGGLGQQTSVFIRGTESDQVLVLFDGIPINDPSGVGGGFDFGSDLLSSFQRVEVVRGPVSSLYGTGAVGGAVNLISRLGAETPFEATVRAEGGNRETFAGSADIAGSFDGFDYAFGVEGLITEGQNITPQRIPSIFEERDETNIRQMAAALGYDIGSLGRVEGSVRLRRNEFEFDNAGSDDPNLVGANDLLTWRIGGEFYATDWLTASVDIGGADHDRTVDNDPDRANFSTQRDRFEGERLFVRGELLADLPDVGVASDSTVTIGIERRDDELRQATSTAFGAFAPFTQTADASAEDYAAYLQGQGRVAGRVDLSGSVRLELPEDYDETVTWRVGGVLQLPEVSSRLKASTGRSFRAPSLFDRFGTNSFGFTPNPDLDPETAFTWEVGGEVDVPLFGREDVVTAGLTYFRTEIDDLIENNFVTNTVENVGEARTRGFETFVEIDPAEWLTGRATYTWLQADNTVTDQQLLRRPRHSFSVLAEIRPIEGLELVPEVQYVGDRYDVTYDNTGAFEGRNRVNEYALFNFAASYQVTDRIEFFARGINLTDNEVEPANAFQGQRLTALGGLTLRFGGRSRER